MDKNGIFLSAREAQNIPCPLHQHQDNRIHINITAGDKCSGGTKRSLTAQVKLALGQQSHDLVGVLMGHALNILYAAGGQGTGQYDDTHSRHPQ
jgi:hypothetical protein